MINKSGQQHRIKRRRLPSLTGPWFRCLPCLFVTFISVLAYVRLVDSVPRPAIAWVVVRGALALCCVDFDAIHLSSPKSPQKIACFKNLDQTC
jgi:hypothetical protein